MDEATIQATSEIESRVMTVVSRTLRENLFLTLILLLGAGLRFTAYPPTRWRTGETIIQSFTLDIPADLPPGVYTVAAGIYGGSEDARLPLDEGNRDWVAPGSLVVGGH